MAWLIAGGSIKAKYMAIIITSLSRLITHNYSFFQGHAGISRLGIITIALLFSGTCWQPATFYNHNFGMTTAAFANQYKAEDNMCKAWNLY